ncbi:hypothetical protein [Paraburkholderia sp. EG304]|uniref:hypothetical protein n=1 Tax=Paraburkholderia sp. EG304 TaxID=3237015 RepID=UPI00397BE5B3
MTTNISVSTEPLRSSKKGDFLGDIAFGKKFCVFYRRTCARPLFFPGESVLARVGATRVVDAIDARRRKEILAGKNRDERTAKTSGTRDAPLG